MTTLEQIRKLAASGPLANEVYSYFLDYQKPLKTLDLNELGYELVPAGSNEDVFQIFKKLQALDLGRIELPTAPGGRYRFHWNEDVVKDTRLALGTGPIAPVIQLRR